MSDVILTISIVVGAMVLLIGLFFIGRIQDPIYRCKTMRKLFKKKNYMVVAVVSKDSKSIQTHVVNVTNDKIVVGQGVWAVMNKVIYRKDYGTGYQTKQGQQITPDSVRFEEGVPILYVNADTITPLDFFEDPQSGKVKPDELGSTLAAWDQAMEDLNLSPTKKMEKIQLITLICAGCGVLLTLWAVIKIGDVNNIIELILQQVR